jgi:hypothetical protein
MSSIPHIVNNSEPPFLHSLSLLTIAALAVARLRCVQWAGKPMPQDEKSAAPVFPGLTGSACHMHSSGY